MVSFVNADGLCSSTNSLVVGEEKSFAFVNGQEYQVGLSTLNYDRINKVYYADLYVGRQEFLGLRSGESNTLSSGGALSVETVSEREIAFCVNREAGREILQAENVLSPEVIEERIVNPPEIVTTLPAQRETIEQTGQTEQTEQSVRETCDNGIDDDSDGYPDCFDADCSGMSSCSLSSPRPTTCCLYHDLGYAEYHYNFDVNRDCFYEPGVSQVKNAGRYHVINERTCRLGAEKFGYEYKGIISPKRTISEPTVVSSPSSVVSSSTTITTPSRNSGEIYQCLDVLRGYAGEKVTVPIIDKRYDFEVVWVKDGVEGIVIEFDGKRSGQMGPSGGLFMDKERTIQLITVNKGEDYTDFLINCDPIGYNALGEAFYERRDELLRLGRSKNVGPSGFGEVETSVTPISTQSVVPIVTTTQTVSPNIVPLTENIEEPVFETVSYQCNGCQLNGKCLPYGTRLVHERAESYCDLGDVLLEQKLIGKSCQNNYECSTNQCLSGRCLDLSKKLDENQGMMERILSFMKNFFGSSD